MKNKLYHFMITIGMLQGILSAIPSSDDLRRIQKHIITSDFLRKINTGHVLPNENSLRSAFRSMIDFELNLQELQFILDAINQAFDNEYRFYNVKAGAHKDFAKMKKFDTKFDGNSLPIPPAGYVYRNGRGDRLFPINLSECITVLSSAPLEGQYVPTAKNKSIKTSAQDASALLKTVEIAKQLKSKRK